MCKIKERTKRKEDHINELALKAGGWYVFSSLLLKAVTTISTPIFTRIMSTDDFGRVSTFFSWASLIIVLCTLNLSYSIGRAKLDYPNELDRYISSMQILSLFVSGSIGSVLLIFSSRFSEWMEVSGLGLICLFFYIISMPIIQFYQNGCRYRYRYKENIIIGWYIALASILLSLFLILTFPGDKYEYRVIGNVAPVVVLALYLFIKSIRAGNVVLDIEYVKYGISLSLPLVMHEIAHYILSQSDRLFIVKFCGTSDTGIYSVAYNYGCLMLVVTSAVSDGWLPWFHDKYYERSFDEIRKNVKWIVLLGAYIGLACIAFAPEAIAVLGGKQYRRGIYCIAPVALGIVCQYVYTHYVNIEMHLKKTKFVPLGTMLAAVVNIILNLLFIPKYGFIAASYTTFVSYFVLMIAHFFYTECVLGVKLYNDYFMFGVVAITSVIAIILVLTYNNNIIRYFIIMMGLCSFMCVYRNFIINWLKKFRNKKII